MTIDTRFYSEKPWRIYPTGMSPDFIEKNEVMIKKLARSLPERRRSARATSVDIPLRVFVA